MSGAESRLAAAELLHLTLDKRRHDPHAPHRYGAGVVYDLALTRKQAIEAPTAQAMSITIDAVGNNDDGPKVSPNP